jgi:hypothetical protein
MSILRYLLYRGQFGDFAARTSVPTRRLIGACLVALVLAGCTQPSSAQVDTDTAFDFAPAITEQRIPSSATLAPRVTDALSFLDEMRAATDRLFRLRMACGRSPRTCVIDALAAPASTYRAALVELMAFRARYGLATVAGHGALEFRVESASRLAGDRAEVHTCATDSLVVFDTTAGTPGIIFDDRFVSMRTTWTLVFHDGVWKWSDERVTYRQWEAGTCGAF